MGGGIYSEIELAYVTVQMLLSIMFTKLPSLSKLYFFKWQFGIAFKMNVNPRNLLARCLSFQNS